MKRNEKPNKEQVMKTIKGMLESYNDEIKILRKTEKKAIKDTLKKYDDFYEYINGEV